MSKAKSHSLPFNLSISACTASTAETFKSANTCFNAEICLSVNPYFFNAAVASFNVILGFAELSILFFNTSKAVVKGLAVLGATEEIGVPPTG